MKNTCRTLRALTVLLTFPILRSHAQGTIGEPPKPSLENPKTELLPIAPACSQPQKLIVPQAVAGRVKLKARLVSLLRDSLFDDARGVVKLPREKEIENLAHKLAKKEEF